MPIANIVRSGRIAATGCARLKQSTHFQGLRSERGNHTSPQSIGDNTSDDSVLSSSKPPFVAAVTAEHAAQLDNTVTAIKIDMEQWKTFAAVSKVELENIKVSVNEVKREVKDLGNKIFSKFEKIDSKFEKIDSKFDKTDAKIDRRSDRTDAKIDRAIYFFTEGLILKGGFDQFMKENTKTKDITVGK